MIDCGKLFKGTPIKLVAQIHDELLFQIPKELVKTSAIKIKCLMENACPLSLPLKVDIKVGKNWLDMEELTI